MSYVDSSLAVLILALWHIRWGRLPLIHSVHHSNWLSFSGGVAVAYVFETLLPKLGSAGIDFRAGADESRGAKTLRSVSHDEYLFIYRLTTINHLHPLFRLG